MAALRNIASPERGVILLDRNNRIISANRRSAEIFDKKPDELPGQDLAFITGRGPAKGEEVLEEVIEYQTGNGILHRYSAPVFGSDGQISGRVEVYSDITARRKLEEEILDRNRELADLNTQLEAAQEQLLHSERMRTLGEMAAGVAHDINNVLGIILGNAQLARKKISDSPDIERCIDSIELAAKDCAETVRRLRRLGKPPDTASYVRIDLSEVAQEVVSAVVPAWRESQPSDSPISVETICENECIILGNPAELREALANLLLNAAQAIESGGTIEVITSKADGYAELKVKDTGAGMDAETQARLFDPFFTTRGAAGTGLGMSMVEAVAIRHGGKVVVESEEGMGTTVSLMFPSA